MIDLGILYCSKYCYHSPGLWFHSFFNNYSKETCMGFENDEKGIELLLTAFRSCKQNYMSVVDALKAVRKGKGIVWSMKNTKDWPKLP